ncbi:ATP-binding cassette domain-containing protein [Paenibacillus sp. P25]|nr:ATP-binding cassette domain-containing protein [Paenibacillus sp. P25]
MIEFQNVSKVYPNGTIGLNNINLTIGKGEFVVIVGLSGAGKSTLLRSINRLHEISEGQILIDGRSITAAKGTQVASSAPRYRDDFPKLQPREALLGSAKRPFRPGGLSFDLENACWACFPKRMSSWL